jgi:hypothetical protein
MRAGPDEGLDPDEVLQDVVSTKILSRLIAESKAFISHDHVDLPREVLELDRDPLPAIDDPEVDVERRPPISRGSSSRTAAAG